MRSIQARGRVDVNISVKRFFLTSVARQTFFDFASAIVPAPNPERVTIASLCAPTRLVLQRYSSSSPTSTVRFVSLHSQIQMIEGRSPSFAQTWIETSNVIRASRSFEK